MKQNLYIFSNSILRKNQNTLSVGINPEYEENCDADKFDGEEILLINPDGDTSGYNHKYIPVENIEAVYVFGCVKTNTFFFGLMSKFSIPVHFFGYYGNYIGTFFPKSEITSGNILIAQVNSFNGVKRLIAAKGFVKGAALNSVNNLKYYQYRGADLKENISILERLISEIMLTTSVGELMGVEGNIKQAYFSSWEKIFKHDIEFKKRVRRPPDNLVNSLISFGNAIIYSVCLNEIYRSGLNPSVGYLHSPGDNRLPLSFDIAEIFKPLITDKVIFRMLNLEMLSEEDVSDREGKVVLKEKAKRKFVDEIEKRLKTTVTVERLKRQVSYRTIIRMECFSFIKFIRDDIPYEPFVQKV